MSVSLSKKVQVFKQLLIEYNEGINIYSKKSYDLIDLHIEDSFSLASILQNGATHVDMGSGAGFPGVFIALISSMNVICIESKEKKRRFLNQVKESLAINNLFIFDGDVQTFIHGYNHHKINSLSAKAFLKPPDLMNVLSLFKPHQLKKDAICWVPISGQQKNILQKFDDVIAVGPRPFYYFKIRMGGFRSYKADLKIQYNL